MMPTLADRGGGEGEQLCGQGLHLTSGGGRVTQRTGAGRRHDTFHRDVRMVDRVMKRSGCFVVLLEDFGPLCRTQTPASAVSRKI